MLSQRCTRLFRSVVPRRVAFARHFCSEKEEQETHADPTTLIFDLTGTIIDITPSVQIALEKAFKENKIDAEISDTLLKKLVVDNDTDSAKSHLEAVVAQEVLEPCYKRYLEHLQETSVNESVLFPNVQDTLKLLQNSSYLMGICTNMPEKKANILVDRFQLAPFFKSVVGGDTIPVKKPDAGHVLYTIETCGGSASKAILIGDDYTDLKAAHSAGVTCILVEYGYSKRPLSEMHPDLIAKEFKDIPASLEKLTDSSMY